MRKQNIKQPGNFKVLGTGSKFRTKDNPSGRPRPCADPKKHLQKQLQSKQKKKNTTRATKGKRDETGTSHHTKNNPTVQPRWQLTASKIRRDIKKGR